MFHNRHAEHQLPRLNSNGIKNKYEGKTELGETAALDFWGLRDVHTFQTHEAMKSATSCKCSPVPRELHSTHLNVEHSKDVRPNSTMTARYTSARVCTSRSPHPVSQLLNTFKSTSRVLFVATTARNATKSLSVFSLSLSFFFFSREIRSNSKLCLLWLWRSYHLRAARGSPRNLYPWAWCWRLLLLYLTNNCALGLVDPLEQEGDVYIMITAFPSRGGFITILRPGNKK